MGRPKGSPNKVVREIRVAAMTYSAEALRVLARIMRSTKSTESARVAAATQILNRAHGLPTSHVEANINLLERLNDDEQRAIAAALEAIARDQGEDAEGAPRTHH